MSDYLGKALLKFMIDKHKSQYADFEGENKNSKLRKKLILKGYNECEQIIEQAPTADVAEVKHGEWLDDIQKITTVAGVEHNGLVGYKCSLCGRREGTKEPYCNCGAKMDGQKNDFKE